MTKEWRVRASSLPKRSIKHILKGFGVGVVRYDEIQRLRSREAVANDMDLLRSISDSATAAKTLEYLDKSYSQLRQDLFVLSRLNFRRDGFFVEFGATNGIDLSNTYLLEKEFGWNGILAEPARRWHGHLRSNRSAIVESSCVWKHSGSSLIFRETEDAEYSTIADYMAADSHGPVRQQGKDYEVSTISLHDLLEKHHAPKVIDYLSIDTEGSEFEILQNFDFRSYKFKVITCEHNYTPMRERIYSLLAGNGYTRVLENVSRFDDWYVMEPSLVSASREDR